MSEYIKAYPMLENGWITRQIVSRNTGRVVGNYSVRSIARIFKQG